MIYLKDFRQGKLLYEALDSEVRLGILEELLTHGEQNLAYFAKRFGVSNGAITAHVKKLHAAGLIEISTSSGVRGTQKICTLATDKVIVDLQPRPQAEGRGEVARIDVGCYSDYEVHGTCGIATTEHVIGSFDDPACFSFPERIKAGILWLGWGYVEYLIPNYLRGEDALRELCFSLEIASEAPGYAAYYPSDISFSVNGVTLGSYRSKGEYNDRAGTCNPSWWYGNLGQYGKKINITVGEDGTSIGGTRVSDVTLKELRLRPAAQIRFRIFVGEDAANRGGFTLFGRGFGDYDEGIVARFLYQ